MQESNVLEIRDLQKTFKSGDSSLTVLKNINFNVEKGISCAIVGPSGSGKTTLLGLCAGLDKPTSGEVVISGSIINDLNEEQLAALRNQRIGFVFQSFQLIPTLTAVENVMVPVELRGMEYKKAYERAKFLLGEVGLSSRINHYPTQLSGGEQQRVAIARAFINDPEILFADEPTGNLDTETGEQIENILFELNKKQGTTLIIVTHDPELAQKCDRIIRLKSGEVESDTYLNKELATAE